MKKKIEDIIFDDNALLGDGVTYILLCSSFSVPFYKLGWSEMAIALKALVGQ